MPIEPYEMPEEIEIEKVLTAFKKYSNYDFSDYSDKSFARRVEKILVDHGLSIDLLVNRMASNPQFLEQVVREITVNTTELFRDIDFWQAIKYRILPKLKRQDCIRIWHAGCSTGQEVYSMAIILHELGLSEKTYLLASDINTDVIQRAKNGIYQYRFNRDYLDNFDKVMRYNPYNYEEVFNIPDEKYFTINQSTDTLSLHKFL
ncbi:MAG: Chemotaxis protein methyltransferase, partial [Bacteroidota bacterium]